MRSRKGPGLHRGKPKKDRLPIMNEHTERRLTLCQDNLGKINGRYMFLKVHENETIITSLENKKNAQASMIIVTLSGSNVIIIFSLNEIDTEK